MSPLSGFTQYLFFIMGRGWKFSKLYVEKDKFAPGQNFEASGATSTAENTKGKKQNFACFDLIRYVLSLSYKKGNSRQI